jgi:hypothetical protein
MNFLTSITLLLIYLLPLVNLINSVYSLLFYFFVLIIRHRTHLKLLQRQKLYKKNKSTLLAKIIKRTKQKYSFKLRGDKYKFSSFNVKYHFSYIRLLKKIFFITKASKNMKKKKIYVLPKSNKKKNKFKRIFKYKNRLSKINIFDYTDDSISNINIYKYDASDTESVEIKVGCRCGSTTHTRTTFTDCRFFGLTQDEIKIILNNEANETSKNKFDTPTSQVNPNTPKCSNLSKRIRDLLHDNETINSQPMSTPKRSRIENMVSSFNYQLSFYFI